MTLRISALFLLQGLIIGPVLRAQSVFHGSHAPQVSFASAEIGRALRLQGATPDRGMRDLTSDKSSLRFAIAAGADEPKALAQTLRVAPLKTVLVQTSNWPNLLRRYAGSELGGHHSGPDCGHGRRPVRQLADLEFFLPDFRCQFNSADRHRRRIEALEAQHRSDPLFYTTVVLFDSVIEILARADTHSFGDRPRSLQLPNGTMRGRICIQRDDARRSVSLHRLLKETFGCSDVPLRREQEIHRSPLLVDSAIEVCPPALHFYIRLVAAP